ncbi:hypothetical protein DFJ63DRAFT_332297 [Scheffersomyces coipomensis]|uniref:uncharacterized protein n=1 Tax=Scheffersomyces coipomensis TaxID=1788519 RepID=UPI00315D3B69
MTFASISHDDNDDDNDDHDDIQQQQQQQQQVQTVIDDTITNSNNNDNEITTIINHNNEELQPNLESQQQQQQQRDDDDGDGDDLENAINNAFGQFDMTTFNDINTNDNNNNNTTNNDNQEIRHQSSHQVEQGEEEEFNFDDVIGKAFDNAIEQHQQEQEQQQEVSTESQQQQQQQQPHQSMGSDNVDNNHEQLSLDDAIDKAFENAMGEHQTDEQSQSIEESSAPTNDGDNKDSNVDDLSLDDAIGKAFENAIGEHHQNEEPIKDTSKENHEEELNLEDAIGKAFENAIGEQPSEDHHPIEETKESRPINETHANEDELNLNDAIGKAFENAIGEPRTEEYHPVEDSTKESKHTNEVEANDEESNLDDAIGKAFENALGEHQDQQQETKEDHNDVSLDDAIGKAFEDAVAEHQQEETTKTSPEVEQAHKDTDEDINLDDAIGKAFESAIQDESHKESSEVKKDETVADQTNDVDLDNAIGSAFESVMGQSKPIETEPPTEPQPTKDNDNDLNLDDAIGAAFENAIKDQTTTIEAPSQKSEDEILDDAIGKAFENAIQGEHTNSDSQVAETSQEPPHETHDDEDELNLDEAIGNAFKNAFGNEANNNETQPQEEAKHSNEFESSHPLPDSTEEAADDKDLENAIGSAFNTILYQEDTTHKTEPEVKHHIGPVPNHDKQPVNEKHQPDDDFDDDLNLDEAIGNAFKNLIPNQIIPEKSKPEEKKDDDAELENAIGAAFRYINQNAPSAPTAPPDHDMDRAVNEDELSSIIAASFQQAISGVETVSSKQGSSSQSRGRSNSQSQSKRSDIPVDVSSLVQSLVNQMANQDDSTIVDHDKLPISEDILQELAAEITNQVQFHLSENDASKKPSTAVSALPQIDDNVFAHFQQEAHKEDIRKVQTSEIVRNNVMTRPSFSIPPPKEKEGDLEQLQMNDILQNAFKMAMENPQELLTDLETDDGVISTKVAAETTTTQVEPEPVVEPPVAPQASSTARFLETLNRSTDIDLDGKRTGSSSEQAKKKSLSIAETLALHRSAMATGASNFANIGSSDSNKGSLYDYGALNSQISQALSSITSRINNGSGSNENLLNIIRQMTNSFTTGLQSSSSTNNSLNANEIISSYADKPEKDTIINSLLLAKKYLYDQSETHAPEASSNSLAATLLDKVLNQFDTTSKIDPSLSKPTSVNAFSADRAPNIRNEFISSIGKSVVAAISNFSSNISGRRSLNSDKPAIDSPEYKEKIRLENRERKKRWREENSDRNKDNDLRSRVLKRAAVMFGEQESPEKKAWADQEFNRRRDRRIAKEEKKEGDKPPTSPTQDKLYAKGKETITKLAQDIELYKPVTDIFNIVSSATQQENPQASLAATAAATATIAAMYADRNQNVTYKQVESAVGSILTSLMESANSLGLNDRLNSLSKGISASFQFSRSPSLQASPSTLPSRFSNTDLGAALKMPTTPSSSILNRISTNIRDSSGPLSYDSLSGFKNLNLQEKRKSDVGLGSDPKRAKVTLDTDNLITERDSFSKIASNLDQMRTSLTTGSTSQLWGSVNSLRMPSYKKSSDITTGKSDQPAVKLEYSTLSLPTSSPFISNKIHTGITASSSGVSAGLRRPGSFQKPSAKVDKTKAKSLGFPRLFSPST